MFNTDPSKILDLIGARLKAGDDEKPRSTGSGLLPPLKKALERAYFFDTDPHGRKLVFERLSQRYFSDVVKVSAITYFDALQIIDSRRRAGVNFEKKPRRFDIPTPKAMVENAQIVNLSNLLSKVSPKEKAPPIRSLIREYQSMANAGNEQSLGEFLRNVAFAYWVASVNELL